MSRKFLIVLSSAMLLVILFFGLKPKGFHLYNNVKWIAKQPGIHFDRYGIAYDDSFFEPFGGSFNIPPSLSIEIALKPDAIDDKNFKFILVFHNGKDTRQLLIGQWRSSIILMNGNDYDSKKKTIKITVTEAFVPQKIRLLTITSGKEGTKLYLDGQLAETNKDLFLKIPDGNAKSRLVVGNSVYGRHSWSGDMYGLAIYGHRLTSGGAERHFKRWSREQIFSFARKDAPEVLYLFDERQGQKAFNKVGKNHDLEIPLKMQILKKEILVPPWYGISLDSSFFQDVIMNFLGFIPFGFLLNALFLKIGGSIKKYSSLLVVVVCLVTSLTIEIVQVWMPSRASQMMDLILNTLGGYTGVVFYRFSRFVLSRFRDSRERS